MLNTIDIHLIKLIAKNILKAWGFSLALTALMAVGLVDNSITVNELKTSSIDITTGLTLWALMLTLCYSWAIEIKLYGTANDIYERNNK